MKEMKPTNESLTKIVPNIFVLVNLLSKRAKEISMNSNISGKNEREILNEVIKELEEGKIAPHLPGT